MFGRSKEKAEAAAAPPPTAAERVAKVGGKNRPTPSRAQVQAANRRPLVPGDRKEAARAAREASRQQRVAVRAGQLAGEEKYLMPRDRGPVRRHVRDIVDARYNIGENLIVIALVILVVQFSVPVVLSANPAAGSYVTVAGIFLLYATLLLIIGDSFVLRRRIRRSVTERFGEEAGREKGLAFYGIMRALQLRRGRTPAVAVVRRRGGPRPTGPRPASDRPASDRAASDRAGEDARRR